ncbi:NUDIX domain-containing protein [Amphiplicatus metriothermophilus]|uniref:GDP-mannose pyrophosphatase n=1 Tax=Amphiplicatus metriothermophilus TaxID=1519374 RepID=A0A239PQ60_9PROT|nr:NUDIX hydrolase [Amphiplicatus metriothermophilus]MBB5518799.1 8-oxo-dGTP pyrophosphatase MutT (NUDIX family) [Amphiplicatus metriothermophilus]SNT72046.1 ADP-ribose pyrophosphatase YjhB, NUDIX family [Amphiplicatus metriothermophilus]
MSGPPPRRVGPWTVLSERIVYDNPWISVVDHAVEHPNGAAGQYGVVRFKNVAVGVLPVDEEGCVWLVGQHRFPHDAYSWELPEGGGPHHESAIETARRELAEETGLTAERWLELAAFDISNSVTDEKAVCFLAWGLHPGEAAPEASEALSIRRIRFPALIEEVLGGQIRDSLTIVMALTAYAKALRGALPDAISDLVLKR